MHENITRHKNETKKKRVGPFFLGSGELLQYNNNFFFFGLSVNYVGYYMHVVTQRLWAHLLLFVILDLVWTAINNQFDCEYDDDIDLPWPKLILMLIIMLKYPYLLICLFSLVYFDISVVRSLYLDYNSWTRPNILVSCIDEGLSLAY